MIEINRCKKIYLYIFLHFIFFLYSLIIIVSKWASNENFKTISFWKYYVLIIGILGVYAFFWQIILKYMQLSIAFANKSVTIIWGMIWSSLIFKEELFWNQYVGSLLIIIGIILVVNSD